MAKANFKDNNAVLIKNIYECNQRTSFNAPQFSAYPLSHWSLPPHYNWKVFEEVARYYLMNFAAAFYAVF